jgi:hypothetical protein
VGGVCAGVISLGLPCEVSGFGEFHLLVPFRGSSDHQAANDAESVAADSPP